MENKEGIKLETIRSTKISTFLIFLPDVDVTRYQVNGEFQELVKFDNIIAILHRQKRPPKQIEIIAPSNQKAILKNLAK